MLSRPSLKFPLLLVTPLVYIGRVAKSDPIAQAAVHHRARAEIWTLIPGRSLAE